jgi:hypothetical protein
MVCFSSARLSKCRDYTWIMPRQLPWRLLLSQLSTHIQGLSKYILPWHSSPSSYVYESADVRFHCRLGQWFRLWLRMVTIVAVMQIGKDRSLLAVQSRDLPTVTEKIRKETSLVCVPAKIRTQYLPGHTSEAATNNIETSLYFCVTASFTENFLFLRPYTHSYTNLFCCARLLYLDCDRSKL